MQEKGNKIIDSAFRVYMRYGIKSVNMDDMSRHLGMSKKTLYQYVTDKEDLVRRCVDTFCTREYKDVKQITKRGLNAIDESLEIMQWVLAKLENMHPSVSFDLEKYHPEVYNKMRKKRQRAIFDSCMLNMKKGQREGLYRKDFKPEVIAKLYIPRIDLIFDQSIFPQAQFNPSQVYIEMFRYHIRGIASPKGLKYLNEKLKHTRYKS